ncbi:tyrosine-type recombinase/integrase [Curvibacter sp. HBC28]|uniref:Tyrosine-type recombinase/integrase n=1 Tax=Curvibacter microcysteis TaxID=3026419 RepID=A0ABT5MCU2_9BURK|nr:site-specific integrase [Curvibacter sp. HBC28]MDD0814251.1 tyrosine-type recombinase/integrase [Curvibacter sp. HBC28]
MGRNGLGVEIRESSIRLSFMLDGKQQRKTLKINGEAIPPTPANIKYAERMAVDIRSRIRFGTFSMKEFFPEDESGPTAMTVTAQLDHWLSAQRIEDSTRAGYESAIKFWKAAPCDKQGHKLGDLAVRAMVTSHCLIALASRPALSGKTVNNYVSVLREAIEMAVTDRLLETNPVEKVPRAKHQKEPPDPFTRDEAERIIGALLLNHPGQVHNLVEFWFWSGMRTSEIFGLTWSNVDRASDTVLVTEALVRGKYKNRTKTNVARTLILNSRAKAALARQRQHTLAAGATVFQDPRYGKAWDDERAFRRSYWTPTLKRLGIRYRRPYNMRHTYATAMLMAGMNPAFCAKQLGHSVDIFLSTYAKWIDGDRNAMEMGRLESALGSDAPQKVAQG